MKEADNVIFAGMSGRLVLASDQSNGSSTFGDVLFLNGTDLWLASEAGTDVFQGDFRTIECGSLHSRPI